MSLTEKFYGISSCVVSECCVGLILEILELGDNLAHGARVSVLNNSLNAFADVELMGALLASAQIY